MLQIDVLLMCKDDVLTLIDMLWQEKDEKDNDDT